MPFNSMLPHVIWGSHRNQSMNGCVIARADLDFSSTGSLAYAVSDAFTLCAEARVPVHLIYIVTAKVLRRINDCIWSLVRESFTARRSPAGTICALSRSAPRSGFEFPT